jgi:cytochrome oxidase assembly protein ShyY1
VRFLLSRRWVLFALAVAVAAWAAVQLGDWQFRRLHERHHSNGVIGRNLTALPVPAQDVLSTEHPPSTGDEWRKVTASGTWDDKHTIVLKYQTRDEGAGIDVVTPLRTASGTAVLVDRGWMASENSGAVRPKLPAPTTGMVTVTGYVRRDATGGSTRIGDMATRAVSSRTISHVVPYPLFQGFLDLDAESPRADKKLGSVELPAHTGDGPHFFYGLQWWFFGVLAVFGFCYLAFDEFRRKRQERAAGEADGDADGVSSEGAGHAPVDREHRAAHEG